MRRVVEVAYLASQATEEGRNLTFNACITPDDYSARTHPSSGSADWWEFMQPRELSLNELRRVAPTVDSATSAVWITWDGHERLHIRGLIHFGPNVFRAASVHSVDVGSLPFAFHLRVVQPGQLMAYEWKFLVAELRAGQIHEPSLLSSMDVLGIHGFINSALDKLADSLQRPEFEHPKEWSNYEFIAWLNALFAVVNAIRHLGHGGALIVSALPPESLLSQGIVRAKYRLTDTPQLLREAVVNFLNARHKFGDALWFKEDMTIEELREQSLPTEEELDRLLSEREAAVRAALEALIERALFVGGLCNVDGAVLLTDTFDVVGFGTEILATMPQAVRAYHITDPIRDDAIECDVEEFGMRHRSAIKLCARVPELFMFVVSQDGDVTLVWSDQNRVLLRRGVNTSNANMVMA